jgi:hypothetical protein
MNSDTTPDQRSPRLVNRQATEPAGDLIQRVSALDLTLLPVGKGRQGDPKKQRS